MIIIITVRIEAQKPSLALENTDEESRKTAKCCYQQQAQNKSKTIIPEEAKQGQIPRKQEGKLHPETRRDNVAQLKVPKPKDTHSYTHTANAQPTKGQGTANDASN